MGEFLPIIVLLVLEDHSSRAWVSLEGTEVTTQACPVVCLSGWRCCPMQALASVSLPSCAPDSGGLDQAQK